MTISGLPRPLPFSLSRAAVPMPQLREQYKALAHGDHCTRTTSSGYSKTEGHSVSVHGLPVVTGAQ
eukprot:12611223-Prorocentrum_lima.AAC.1